jgi:RNA polymerase sigma-70 factor (ECF subfamily)
MQATSAKSFRDLMEEVRAGSQDAAWELVDLYGPHVQRFVRRIMHRQLRSKFDSIDFVQIMWASLFREPERFATFDQPEQLVSFLITIARHKVLNELRKRTQTAKYGPGEELEFNSQETPQSDKQPPTPSAVLIAKERWQVLLSNQNALVQSVVSLRLRGETYADIADKLQINERTARKCIAKLTGEEEELDGPAMQP